MDNVGTAFVAEARRYLSASYLPKIEQCVARLTDEQLWWRANEESNSIGNLLLHLSGNLRQWVVSGVGGATDHRLRQQEFDERAMVPAAALLAKLKATVSEADAVLAALPVESLLETRVIQGRLRTVLEAVFHVVEHFSMHAGQIIYLTKWLTGEDVKLTKSFHHHTLIPEETAPL